MGDKSIAAFRKRLKEWYPRNKRAMPWRGTRDAYRVWVSEIMLQQTRVAAVLPYYLRFVRRFPTVRALARARSEDVLRLWAGLGYYSRARNLHRAAKEIVARHGGKFPRSFDAALALPGVGRYTAAAVLSIAYGEPRAVVDGNVARVVARLGGMRGDVRANGRWRKIEEAAQELMSGQKIQKPKFETRNSKLETREMARSELRAGRREQAPVLHEGRRLPFDFAPFSYAQGKQGGRAAVQMRRQDAGGTAAGEWNQAMMELGATVCTPRAPRCGECPVARWCRARVLGIAEKIPASRKKRETHRVEIAVLVPVDARGRTLLVKPERCETNGLFSNLWQFPAVKGQVTSGKWLVARLKQNILEPQMNADRRRWKNNRKDLRQRAQRSTEGTDRNEERSLAALPSTSLRAGGMTGKYVGLGMVRHTVTFREVTVRPWLVRVEQLRAARGERVVALGDVEKMAVSSATKKIARSAVTSGECLVASEKDR